jgi:hypothetical protein
LGDDQDERDSDFGSCKSGIEISPSTSWGLNGGITNNWWFNKACFWMFTGPSSQATHIRRSRGSPNRKRCEAANFLLGINLQLLHSPYHVM